jgi:cytochrome c553
MRRLAACLGAAALLAAGACGPGTPEDLYVRLGCPRCHGQDLRGNRYGPPLTGLDALWDSSGDLVAYLRDPQSVVVGEPRLQAARKEYGLMMLPVTRASDQEIEQLAAWLLDGSTP